MENSRKILIIDDDPVTIALVSQLLQKNSYEIDIARDGDEGQNKLQDLTPNLVICDVVLPKVDGFAFCREFLRSHPNIPLVIVSSKIQAKDAFLSMGAAAFLPKPIDTKLLLAAIVGLIGEEEAETSKENSFVTEVEESSIKSEEEPEVHSAEEISHRAQNEPLFSQELLSRNRPAKGRKILLVDDEPALQEMMRLGLTQAGYTVETANNGQEGLARINAEAPDLIIADVLMPVMDGYAFYRELKRSKTTDKIPVLMLTARSKLKDSFEALGAEFFITKPFDPDGLLSRIDQLMEVNPSTAALEPKMPQAASPSPVVKEEPKPLAKEEKKALLPGAKKVLALGYDEKSMKSILQYFESEGCQLNVVKESGKVVDEYNSLEPCLIILQVSLEVATDKIVGDLASAVRGKKRSNETDIKNKKTKAVFKEPAIVLYKVAEEVKVGSGGTENLVAMEDLIQRCQDNGSTKYIGQYSTLSFPSKIREFIKI